VLERYGRECWNGMSEGTLVSDDQER